MSQERASGVSDKQVAAMSSSPSSTPASRRGYQVWMGAAVVVLLVGLCLLNLFGRRQPPPLPVPERNNQPIEPTPPYTLINHLGGVNSVCLSPDGALLAVGGGNVISEMSDGTTESKGEIQLRRVSDGALLHTLQGHTWGITSIAFSPDGALLALGRDNRTISLWRVSDGALLYTLEGHKGLVIGVSFSSNNALLASGSVDGTVRLWRLR